MKKIMLVGLCLLPFAMSAGAQEQKRKRPPKEAVEACKSKASGDACSFESPRGTVSGTCWAPRTDLPLACKPANPPE